MVELQTMVLMSTYHTMPLSLKESFQCLTSILWYKKNNKTKQQQKTKTTTTTKSKVVKRGLYSHRQRYSPSKCCGLTKRSVEVSGGQKGEIDGSIFLTPCRRNHKRTLPDASPG